MKDESQTLQYTHSFRILTEEQKLNKTTIYRGRYRLILTDQLKLCDDGNVLSKKKNLIKVGKLLGVEAKTCDEIPNICWNVAHMDTDG